MKNSSDNTIKNVLFKYFDHFSKNAELYYYPKNNSIYMLFPYENNWVFEFWEDSGHALYSYPFFRKIFDLLSLSVKDNEDLIRDWIEKETNTKIKKLESGLPIFNPNGLVDIIINGNKIERMNPKQKIKEGFTEHGTPNLKYYAFDWDDNIMVMPTKIMVLDDEGNEVGMSTEDFAEYRTMIGREPFDYKRHTIVGLDYTTAFRNFRVDGEEQFKIDVFEAKKGPVWKDFVEAINNGSIFAIITARGHSPQTLRDAIYNMIVMSFDGIDRKQLVKNLKKFRNFMDMENMSEKELIDSYLDMCRFYPVSYGVSVESNPEQAKVDAMNEFVTYVKQLSQELQQRAKIKNLVMNKFVPSIGFSDDDERNVELMKRAFKDKPDNILQTYLTKGGKKEKY